MLSSDALSSIAYGPEQVILVLVSLSPLAIGGAPYRYFCPLTAR